MKKPHTVEEKSPVRIEMALRGILKPLCASLVTPVTLLHIRQAAIVPRARPDMEKKLVQPSHAGTKAGRCTSTSAVAARANALIRGSSMC